MVLGRQVRGVIVSKVIGIDVDLTACAIDVLWYVWLERMTGHTPTEITYAGSDVVYSDKLDTIDYNLTTYWKEFLDARGMDGLDFFRGTNIYDFADPIEGAVECVNELYKAGYEIIFISALKGHHHKSKYEWLARNFKFHGFVGTQEKQYVNCDVLIEDRNKFLNKSKAPVKIKLMTQYTQCEELTCDVKVCHDWYEIYNYIKEINDEQ